VKGLDVILTDFDIFGLELKIKLNFKLIFNVLKHQILTGSWKTNFLLEKKNI
jgi:hypothetical protein